MALKTVRAGAGLVRPSTQTGGAQCLELPCQRHDLLFAFDRARAGDDGDSRSANFQPERLNDRSLAFEFRGSPLVRRHDRQDFLDPLARLEDLGQPRPFVTRVRR